MFAAAHTLKCLHPTLFHVTCIAHLLYNGNTKAKAQFHTIDQTVIKEILENFEGMAISPTSKN